MEIDYKQQEGIDIFELSGKLDVQSSPDVQSAVVEKIVPECKVVVDMSGCDYVSSSGLRVILIMAKQSAAVVGKVVLVGVQSAVADVMEMTGFSDLLNTFDNMEDAMASL